MKSKFFVLVCFMMAVFVFTSCDKGYEVRFTNYYIEPMDSVVIGNDYIIFTNVGLESTTDYKKLMSGKHWVLYVTKSKKRLYSSFTIPSKGSGKRTVQIDGIEQVSLLDD